MDTQLITLIVNSTVTVVGMVTALGTAIVAYRKAKLTAAKVAVVDEKIEVTHEVVKTLVDVAPIGITAKDDFQRKFRAVFHRDP